MPPANRRAHDRSDAGRHRLRRFADIQISPLSRRPLLRELTTTEIGYRRTTQIPGLITTQIDWVTTTNSAP